MNNAPRIISLLKLFLVFFLLFLSIFIKDSNLYLIQQRNLETVFDTEFLELINLINNNNNKNIIIVSSVRQLKWLNSHNGKFILCYSSEIKCINESVINNYEVFLIYSNADYLNMMALININNDKILTLYKKNDRYSLIHIKIK